MSVAHSAENVRTHLATVPNAGHRPPCEGCGAPLDQQQRYCVHCGTRRPDVDDPALTWMAARKERLPATQGPPAQPPARNPLALSALALVLLPIVAAAGVLVGRGGGNDPVDPRLLQALRSQKAPVVKVGDVAAGGTTAAATTAKKTKASAKKA